MIRVVLWGIFLSAGLLILILLGGIVTFMVQQPSDSALEIQPRFDLAVDVDSAFSTQEPREDEVVQELIKQIYDRKGYSNPKPTSEDDEEVPDKVVRKRKRTRRPLRIIDKDFNPHTSYTIKHPNGTLTYVFPSYPSSTAKAPYDGTTTFRTIVDRFSVDRPSDNFVTDHPQVYPTELIDSIMDQYKTRYEGAFGNDTVIPSGDELNSRFDISNDEFLCESEESLVLPRVGYTRDNSTVQIVNTENYQQGVRIETCRDAGKPCNFCDGENTVCKQIYHFRTLVAVNLKTEKPYKELIRLPSSCKCARRPH